MSIFKKLEQLETIVDGVLTPDREQNHKIIVRQIRDELNINMNKTMNDILNHPIIKPYVKPKETYMVTGSFGGEFRGYLSRVNPPLFFMNYKDALKLDSPKTASGLIDLINSLGNTLVCGIVSLSTVQQDDLEIEKSKDELVNEMHSLISKGENIPAEMHNKWNEFVENY